MSFSGKILANDGMHQDGIDLLEAKGFEVDTTKRDHDELVRIIGEYDGLSVRSTTKVTEDVLLAGFKGNLQVVGRQGVGTDNIDLTAASDLGILVQSAPNGNTNATAEHAFGLMLDVSRNISQANYTIKEGEWRKKEYRGQEISGKTLGIIGCGRIGQRVSHLVRGFDMNVLGYDMNPDAVQRAFPDSSIQYVELPELLQRSDYVTLHTGGKNIILGSQELELMKPTAYLINVSRAENVDQNALYAQLRRGGIAGAGIDVHVNEPKVEGAKYDNGFRAMKNVVLTSHLGASTDEAQIKTSREMAGVMADFLLNGAYTGAVNAHERSRDERTKAYAIRVFHEDIPGMFGYIAGALGSHDINIREIPSRGMKGDGMALASCIVHSPPTEDALSALRNIQGVKRVVAPGYQP